MRILILHNAYRQRGGEDVSVEAEAQLLRQAGHGVRLELVSNDAITGFAAKTRAFVNAPHDARKAAWFTALAQAHGPDLVHIHNFFPLLTPAVHMAAAQSGIAVVQSLHNYRLLCAGAQFLRQGQVCEKCLAGNRAWGVAHRCYRGSFMGSLAAMRMQNRTAPHKSWARHVHRFIVLSAFGRGKFIAGGFCAHRIAIKPNFAPDPGNPPPQERSGALFVGRLSPEKGLTCLLAAWRELGHIPLTIVGDGPMRAQLEKTAPGAIRFLGAQPPQAIRELMRRSAALILPSIWYEGFPMVLVEAYSCALPVIGSHIGALAELIAPDETGALFAPGNSAALALTVQAAFSHPQKLSRWGALARASYLSHYTPQKNLAILEDIYRAALSQARAGD